MIVIDTMNAGEIIDQEIQGILDLLNGAYGYHVEADGGNVWVEGRLSAGALALSFNRVTGGSEVWDLIYPLAKMLERGEEVEFGKTLDDVEDLIIEALSQSADKLLAQLYNLAAGLIGEEYLDLYMSTCARRDFENEVYWLQFNTPAAAFWNYSLERLRTVIDWADRGFCQNGAYMAVSILTNREMFDCHVQDGRKLLDMVQRMRGHLATVKLAKDQMEG